MKNTIYIHFILLLILSFFTLLGFSKNKIDVALFTNLTNSTEIGENEVMMTKLYFKLNPKSRIKLEVFNDGWNKDMVHNAMDKLLRKNIKFLITTHTSTVANEIANDINKNNILTFVLGATTINLSQKDDFHIRLICDVKEEQTQIANYINNYIKGNNITLIIDTYNKGYTHLAKEYFVYNCNKNIVNTIYFNANNFNIDTIEKSFTTFNFDIAYFIVGSGFSKVGSIAQFLYLKNMNIKLFFTPWVLTQKLNNILGPARKNAIFTSFLPNPANNEKIRFLKNKFYCEYKIFPANTSYKVYQALELIDLAFSNDITNPLEVKRYLLNQKSLNTYFQTFILDKYGDFYSNLFFFNDLQSFYSYP